MTRYFKGFKATVLDYSNGKSKVEEREILIEEKDYDEAKARDYFMKKVNNGSLVIVDLEKHDGLYQMPNQEFFKNATLKVKGEAAEETDEETEEAEEN